MPLSTTEYAPIRKATDDGHEWRHAGNACHDPTRHRKEPHTMNDKPTMTPLATFKELFAAGLVRKTKTGWNIGIKKIRKRLETKTTTQAPPAK